MKVNITLKGVSRAGYLNLHAFANEPNQCSPSNISPFVDDAECEDIIALDVLDYFPAPDVLAVLTHWISKLRHGGTLTIGGVDMRAVCKGMMERRLTLDEANQLLYGKQDHPWRCKRSSLTLRALSDALVQLGLKVRHKRIEAYHYYITVERP